MQLTVYETHPFAQRAFADIHELAGEDIIMLDRRVSPEIVDFICSRCEVAGFSLNAARYVSDVENAAAMVSAGRGVSFVHSMMTFVQPLDAVGVRLVDITGAEPLHRLRRSPAHRSLRCRARCRAQRAGRHRTAIGNRTICIHARHV